MIVARHGLRSVFALFVIFAGIATLPVNGASVSARAAERTTALAIGDAAPAFTLIDQQGQRLRLADLLQSRDFVVVAFYVKAFTGG